MGWRIGSVVTLVCHQPAVMLRWTAVILGLATMAVYSTWRLKGAIDQMPRGKIEDMLELEEVVRLEAEGLLTKSCQDIGTVKVSKAYVEARPQHKKDICEVINGAVVCRPIPTVFHDGDWLEETLKKYLWQHRHQKQDVIRNDVVQCLLSKIKQQNFLLTDSSPAPRWKREPPTQPSTVRTTVDPPRTTVQKTTINSNHQNKSARKTPGHPGTSKKPQKRENKTTKKQNDHRTTAKKDTKHLTTHHVTTQHSTHPTSHVITTVQSSGPTSPIEKTTATAATDEETSAETKADTALRKEVTFTAVPVQNASESGAFDEIKEQPQIDIPDEEDTKRQKTTMFLIIMGVLAIAHVCLISLLILSCRCYVTRRNTQKANKKGAGAKYTQMKQPQKMPNVPPSRRDQQQSDTLDLWTDRRPSDTRLRPSR